MADQHKHEFAGVSRLTDTPDVAPGVEVPFILRLPDGTTTSVRAAGLRVVGPLRPEERKQPGRVLLVLANGPLHMETDDGLRVEVATMNGLTPRAFLDSINAPPGELQLLTKSGNLAAMTGDTSDAAPSIGPFCSIAPDVRFGLRVKVFGHANIYGCAIGDDSRIGTFVEIQRDAVIGKRVRVQSHTFICSGIVIEDDVFISHNVNFINDRYPSAPKAAPPGTWTQENTRVCRGATIGTGSIVLCGLTIGEGAVIGAGSVVTHDVPPHAVVAGVPGRILRVLDQDERWLGGERLPRPAKEEL